MTDLIKIHYPRPYIHFKSHWDELEDANNGIVYPLNESGYAIRTLISDIIDRWHLRPDDVFLDKELTKSQRKRNKGQRSPEWMAYESVIRTNRYHPEDVVTLHKHVSEAFNNVLEQKYEAITELHQIRDRKEISNEQCDKLVGYMDDTIKHLKSDGEWCLIQLLDLIIQLKRNPDLWEGKIHETH